MDIEVVLPNGKREVGDVDPAALLEEIKEDIVKAYSQSLGSNNPNDFYLLMGNKNKNKQVSLENFNPIVDAIFYLISREKFRTSAFTPKT